MTLGQEDIAEAENEMFREKIYHKFLNDPFNMEKHMLKKVRRAKTNKQKHIDKALRLVDALTALHNDSQRLLRYDVRHMFWKILIEGYEFTSK